MSSPIRELRERIAAALDPLGVEVVDVLPDHVNPPTFAVGLATVGPSITSSTILTYTIPVTLVGERADFTNAQYRLDDLEWSAWEALRALPGVWLLGAGPGSIDVAGQQFPSVVFTVEAPTPC